MCGAYVADNVCCFLSMCVVRHIYLQSINVEWQTFHLSSAILSHIQYNFAFVKREGSTRPAEVLLPDNSNRKS